MLFEWRAALAIAVGICTGSFLAMLAMAPSEPWNIAPAVSSLQLSMLADCAAHFLPTSPPDVTRDCTSDLGVLDRVAAQRRFITTDELSRIAPCCLARSANARNKVDLDDVLVIVATSRSAGDRVRLATETWAQNFPHVDFVSDTADPEVGTVTCPADACAHDSGRRPAAYLQHLHSIGDARVEKPFILLISDETFLIAESLRSMLARVNPACPLLLGAVTVSGGTLDFDYPALSAGILLTHEAVTRTLPLLLTDQCSYHGGGVDKFVARCAIQRRCQVVHSIGFHDEPPPVLMDRTDYMWPQIVESFTLFRAAPDQAHSIDAYLRARATRLESSYHIE